MNLFFSNAVASSNRLEGDNITSMVVMCTILIAIFYFMIFRPQQKRNKERKKLMDSIKKGDEVLTNGGLMGYVIKISNLDYVIIALNDTTEVIIKRDFITAILPKGTLKELE